jgi:Pyruvate/2-oxoacid:ferredoxin oxidoreductase gamma subunit
MMIGALAGISELPMDRTDFKTVISRFMPPGQMKTNMATYDMGTQIISRCYPSGLNRKIERIPSLCVSKKQKEGIKRG